MSKKLRERYLCNLKPTLSKDLRTIFWAWQCKTTWEILGSQVYDILQVSFIFYEKKSHLSEFWEDHFKCRYPKSLATPYNQNYTRECTGREKLTRENTQFEAQLQFVSDAVMAFAHAFKWVLKWKQNQKCKSAVPSVEYKKDEHQDDALSFKLMKNDALSSYRDMHAFECGKDYVGLCDNMTTINGETLLKFLRNVSFTGERFILFLPPHLLKCPHKSWKLMKKSEQVLVDQNWFFLLERWGKHFPIEPDFFGLKRLFWPWLNSIVIAHSIFSSGLTGDEFKFNQHGDGPARYNIIHYKQVSKGQFEWVTVGYFYDDRMQLDMDGKSDNNRPLDYYFRDAAIFFFM